jgi:hypothetical protein
MSALQKRTHHFEVGLYYKAFDTIEHNTILLMTKSLGFSETWFGWIERILATVSS